MLSKLLSALAHAKGAAAATVVAAAAVGTGVAASNQDVQNAINDTIKNVTQQSDTSDTNQPAVVTARNKADADLRAQFQIDQQALEKLHSTHVDSASRATLESTLKTDDAALRAELTKALDKVATWTIGREGRESPKPTGSPDIKQPVTAQAELDAWVTAEKTAMDAIVTNATAAVALLQTADPGKPADAGKPADLGKPATVPTPPAHP
jgi:tetrahydromethanopterin S-methyltransferase subunit H